MKEQTALINIDQLACSLGLSKRWLHSEAMAGRIPSLRAGAKQVFNRDAVERAILKLAAESTEHSGSDQDRVNSESRSCRLIGAN